MLVVPWVVTVENCTVVDGDSGDVPVAVLMVTTGVQPAPEQTGVLSTVSLKLFVFGVLGSNSAAVAVTTLVSVPGTVGVVVNFIFPLAPLAMLGTLQVNDWLPLTVIGPAGQTAPAMLVLILVMVMDGAPGSTVRVSVMATLVAAEPPIDGLGTNGV